MDKLNDLYNLFAAIDNAFVEVQKQYGDEVSCGKGCDDCCHAVFDVSLIEAVQLLKHFQSLPSNDQKAILVSVSNALKSWEELILNKKDFPAARIKCPLLNKQGLCSCYESRPVNCRTYGIPTAIGGTGHVCGFSCFEKGKQYPTVNLEQIHQALHGLSVDLADSETGSKRWPIAAVLLSRDEFARFLDNI